MESMGIGICAPCYTPSLLPQSRKPLLKPNAVSGSSSGVSDSFSASKWGNRILADFQFLPYTNTTNTAADSPDFLSRTAETSLSPPYPPPLKTVDRHVSMPIEFYRVLGAEAHFLGDGIRRCYEARVSRPPQYGYTEDALFSRRQILQAACETLATPGPRREYNQRLAEDEFDTILTQVPWESVPGALCVLQESGEVELVLQIGESLLREGLPKRFKQDVVLAMALSYVDLSRDAMALSPPDYINGCESLERALKLLQEEGASSLAPDLQAQIDETLEDINPHYVLELLALPLDDEYSTRRAEGLQGVRNILWAVGGGGATAIGGSFTHENFMKKAFLYMTTVEQVELFTATPNNIPARSFEAYQVVLALVAQAVLGRKPPLIQDADKMLQKLQQSRMAGLENSDSLYTATEDHEEDYALVRGLCSLLLGDVDECHSWLGLDDENSPYRNPSIVTFVKENCKDDSENNLQGLCVLLETWLMELVFPRFRETVNVKFKLRDYYDDPSVLQYLERLGGVGGSALAAAAAIARIGAEATAVLDSVKVGALQALQVVFPLGQEKGSIGRQDNIEINNSVVAFETKYDDRLDQHNSVNRGSTQEIDNSNELSEQEMITAQIKDAAVKIITAGLAVGLISLVALKYIPARRGPSIPQKEFGSALASVVTNVGDPVVENTEDIPRMDARLAEGLVHKWQNIKSKALGPGHNHGELAEVLDGQMLKVWSERASEIAQQGWFWEYSLLNVNIDSVTISLDGRQAIVEATLEETAELTDTAHPEHNDSYRSTYTTRYEMSFANSGWKITKGAVLKS